jgi:hypothetical protein
MGTILHGDWILHRRYGRSISSELGAECFSSNPPLVPRQTDRLKMKDSHLFLREEIMPRTPGWFNHSTDAGLDTRKRELEIQLSCNQRRIAEIERDSLSLTTNVKPRLRPDQGTIVPLFNPHSGKQEFFLVEASKAVEFMRLQEEKEYLQKRADAIEHELAHGSAELPTPDAPEHTPRSQSKHQSKQKANTLPWDGSDSPLRYEVSGSSHHPSEPSQPSHASATEQSAGSGFGTFLAFLTAIGLTLLLL